MGGNFDPALGQLAVETLLTYGAADSDYTGEQVMTHLEEVLPNAALARFERNGHWPYLEEPEKFQQVLGEFLAQTP
jgi:pimeloyl-ACP methyl ester carboxylesterase